ncbi:DUF1641 domain-containing protein [Gemmatimonas sp.]|uniref:DUF1641 domain-containing protein n=1 Tax=Gemmatimonas sp. TaxID=1962908 RepID=UPI0022C13663|nr:DUF1641 domain-containing protein [Gemmatimonas sp.]MCZ8204214.1 DUF1641 domain-containing protein [Gemmatimonas sp.]
MAFGLADGNTERQEQLLARLSDPQTVESLNKLLDRMDIIVFAVEALDGFLSRADTIADNVSDSVGDIRTLMTESGTTGLMEKLPQLARAGAQVADISATPAFQRLASSGLIDQLGEPKTIETVRALIAKLDLAAFALESMDGFLRRGDEIAEGIADGVNDLRNAGSTLDLAEMRRTMQSLPKLVQAGNELVASGILDPVVVGQLAEVGHLFARAYSTAKETHPRQHGMIGLALKLRDPDVNRAINFALRLAKAFGKNLNK